MKPSDDKNGSVKKFLFYLFEGVGENPQYGAGDLRKVSPHAIEEFFMDFLMRKVMLKPPEYIPWPPALRLFYTFLFEKGYLDDPGPMLDLLNEIEPDFIELVKNQS